jgi:hypothetical protein
MRKILYGLGLVSLVLVAILIGGIAVIAYKGNKLDAESKGFVDTAVPAISANWSSKALLERASPEFVQSVSADQLKAAFDQFSTLGRLTRYEGSQGEANMAFQPGPGSSISASYTAKARFENGEAVFRIALVKRDGDWLIRGFNIEPAGLLRSSSAHA